MKFFQIILGIKVYDFDGTLVKENSPDVLILYLSQLNVRYKLVYFLLYNSITGYTLGKLGVKNNRKLWYFFLAAIRYSDYLKACKAVAEGLTFNAVILDLYRNDSVNAWISSASFREIICFTLHKSDRIIANEMKNFMGFAIPCELYDNYSFHKVKKWKKINGDVQVEKVYTDSLTDLPLMNYASSYFLINDD